MQACISDSVRIQMHAHIARVTVSILSHHHHLNHCRARCACIWLQRKHAMRVVSSTRKWMNMRSNRKMHDENS